MSHAQLRLWPALAGARIAPALYGYEMEMVGRGIYDGIWAGRTSRSATEDGIRLDVLALLKHLRVPMLKWPGDAFADFYHWEDGVATGEERAVRVNAPWQQVEPNQFGLHEFMHLCEKLGCTPWITCNGHTGTLDEALAWVEYATFGGETDRTRARSQAGSPDPYEIPLWSASRDGGWCAGNLKSVNPEIEVIAPWAPAISEMATPGVDGYPGADMVSFRHFFRNGPGQGFGREGYESSFRGLLDFESVLRRCISGLVYRYGDQAPGIALREWGVWHDEASVDNGLEQPNTLRDALLAASVYNTLNLQAAHVKVAALCHAINALQCLAVTQGSDMYLTPTCHVADMMAPHRGARLITQRLETPDMELQGGASGKAVAMPALSVSASRSGKRLCITVVNRSYTDAIPLGVEIREADIRSLTGRMLHAETATAENSFDDPKNVTIQRRTLTPDGNTFHDTLPPHSFASYAVTLGRG